MIKNLNVIKKGCVIFIIFTILVGTCGCFGRSKKQEAKIAELTEVVSKKYNKDFKFEYFKPARDYTYTNILTLSYGEYIFNVYQKGDKVEDIADNFPIVIINKRITDYLVENNAVDLSDVGLHTYYLFNENNTFSYDYAVSESTEKILEDNSLIKVIVLVNTYEKIIEKKETLYEIYKIYKGLNPKYIDFEVLQIENITEEIDKVLNNITGYYDNDWNKYKGIKAYIDITENNDIFSADDLVREVK